MLNKDNNLFGTAECVCDCYWDMFVMMIKLQADTFSIHMSELFACRPQKSETTHFPRLKCVCERKTLHGQLAKNRQERYEKTAQEEALLKREAVSE